jgi:DNA-binding transcriptional MerR regulator
VLPDEPARFTIADLVEASGLTERTIRYYIQEGLVSPALGRGRARYYTTQHMQELTAVADLRNRHLSIDEIRERLSPQGRPAARRNDLDGETWERVYLHPDLELAIRANAPESVRALARDLRDRAHEWLGNDPW